MDSIVSEFIIETNESLDKLDASLIKLESDPNDQDLLSDIFRMFHTVKGTCGFLNLPRLEKVAHAAEDVLDVFRQGSLKVEEEYVTLILESIDRIKYIICELEFNEKEPDGDDNDLITRLRLILDDKDSKKSGVNIDTDLDEDDSNKEIAETSDKKEKAKVEEINTKVENRTSSLSSQSLRVNVSVLEDLMDMTSELVLARNQLLQVSRSQSDNEFSTPLGRLDSVVSELQEGVMQTRMQPIGNAWEKLPRIVRDVSLDLGKKIEIQMKGQETELDRQVLDLIRDPLTHMIRNSADHGIETPEERVKNGKPEVGTIHLSSYHEGGHIIIEIEDDGRGLNSEKIKEKIIKNKLASEEELKEMSIAQIHQFIFKAGLSTAENVTSVSGRGVGMDVVRENIEKIGGSIELSSKEGAGTKVTIKIPLTLAIVSALIIESGKQKFAIPQLSVRELVKSRINGEDCIEMIKDAPFFRLRDRLLPLVSLNELLGYEDSTTLDSDESSSESEKAGTSGQEDAENRGSYIIVVQVGSCDFGIIVDRVFDTEEIVIKPSSKILSDIQYFSGNTILGDGSVIMILDPSGIANECVNLESNGLHDSSQDDIEEQEADKTSVLLFNAGSKTPRAVPLDLISRLEKINPQNVERANGQDVIQYRGSLMPLIKFNDKVSFSGEEEKPFLVFADGNQNVGLIVDDIVDISKAYLDVSLSGDRDILGSCVIDSNATDIINVPYFLNLAKPQASNNSLSNVNYTESMEDAPHLLFIDESEFFSNMLIPILKLSGYEVTSVQNAEDIIDLYESGNEYDLIISDAAISNINDADLENSIGSSDGIEDVPLVELSSYVSSQNIGEDKDLVDSDDMQEFDQEVFLNAVKQTLKEYQKK